jgi:DUF438 domain-containing protein
MSIKLKEVLKGLSEGDVEEDVALKEIKKASSLELSKAEQELLEEGLSTEDLKGFCKLHLKAVEDKLEELKSSLEEGHPIRTMVSEHEEILKFLDELDGLLTSFEKGISGADAKVLQELAEHLVETEKHHEREENALFPRMEEKGITGPTRIMRMEHDELRPEKKRLLELSKEPEKNKEEIIVIINLLSAKLRDHIFKENNILYPAALQAIKNKEEWNRIKIACDEIGYCCFTPGV